MKSNNQLSIETRNVASKTRNVLPTVRLGFTLVELMVALAVISVLAGIALPTVKNSLRSQRVARGASLLQSAIEEGRARSIFAGGGGGIIIDRIGSEVIEERSASVRVRMATTPPAYSGDVGNSTVKLGVNQNGTIANVNDDIVALWFDRSAVQIRRSAQDIVAGAVPTLINVGDLVSVGDAGLPMRINSIAFGTIANRAGDGLLASDVPDADLTPAAPEDPYWVRVVVDRPEINLNLTRFVGQDMPYTITRTPRPAISMPIEMSPGTAIDLTASGFGRFGNQFSPMAIEGNFVAAGSNPFLTGTRDYQSIYILFGSRGEVSRVLAAAIIPPATVPVLADIPVTGDIHFLVGQAGKIKSTPADQLEDSDPDALADEAKDGKTPLLDTESIWVTIRARNGEVISSPWIDPTPSTTALVPAVIPNPTDAQQQNRIQIVIGRTRSAAVDSRDMGSL
ncbi:MAG: Tfp pilus assembly protein FimT/FimU [Rubripirellula sp.]